MVCKFKNKVLNYTKFMYGREDMNVLLINGSPHLMNSGGIKREY